MTDSGRKKISRSLDVELVSTITSSRCPSNDSIAMLKFRLEELEERLVYLERIHLNQVFTQTNLHDSNLTPS
jgi:hypothetical protein